MAQPDLTALVLEVAGAAVLSSGAWMGGTLVYRNQIGVDHRYARAGQVARGDDLGARGDFVTVADAEELKPGQMKLLHINGRRWVVARNGRRRFARAKRPVSSSRSSRIAVRIAAGRWRTAVWSTARCSAPWHGSQFEVKTGQVVAGPAKDNIATCEVRIDGGNVKLRPVESHRPRWRSTMSVNEGRSYAGH